MVLSKLETSNSTFYYRDDVDVAYMNENCTEFYFGDEYFYIHNDLNGCKFHLFSKDDISFPCNVAIPDIDCFFNKKSDVLSNFIDSIIEKSKHYRDREYDYDHDFGTSATLQVRYSYKFGEKSIKISGLKFKLSDEFVNLLEAGVTNKHISSILAQYVHSISQIN